MKEEIHLITKQDVCKMLGIKERTLEKLVAAGKFPAGIPGSKRKRWVASVVQTWLYDAVATQLNWKPPKRQRA